eukprot:Colp12_sorted_trinity150504_noHs@844
MESKDVPPEQQQAEGRDFVMDEESFDREYDEGESGEDPVGGADAGLNESREESGEKQGKKRRRWRTWKLRTRPHGKKGKNKEPSEESVSGAQLEKRSAEEMEQPEQAQQPAAKKKTRRLPRKKFSDYTWEERLALQEKEERRAKERDASAPINTISRNKWRKLVSQGGADLHFYRPRAPRNTTQSIMEMHEHFPDAGDQTNQTAADPDAFDFEDDFEDMVREEVYELSPEELKNKYIQHAVQIERLKRELGWEKHKCIELTEENTDLRKVVQTLYTRLREIAPHEVESHSHYEDEDEEESHRRERTYSTADTEQSQPYEDEPDSRFDAGSMSVDVPAGGEVREQSQEEHRHFAAVVAEKDAASGST